MKIASLLIPFALLSALTAQGQLPDSFRERLAQASRENKTIQCDFTQHRQVRRMKGERSCSGPKVAARTRTPRSPANVVRLPARVVVLTPPLAL